VWNNLRARHYSVLILLAIVALETSAIAIDRFINRESEAAFSIESPFQNNPFIQSFRMAEASCAAVPVKINRTRTATPVANAPVKMQMVKSEAPATTRTVSTEIFAAANERMTFNNYVEYSIQPGDSLSNIASLFGSDTDNIKKANQLEDKHNIKAGQTIKVPMPGQEMSYTVKKGDSLTRIASRFRIPIKDLIEENNLKSHVLMADQKIKIPVNINKPEVSIIKADNDMTEKAKKLELVKSEVAIIVPENKMQIVRQDKLLLAQAQAPASKPSMEFLKNDLLKNPPAVTASVQTSSKQAVADTPVTVPVKTATEEEISYKVVKGDSLLKIAHRFNTTVAQIQEANNLNGTMLKIDQELKINPDKKLYRVVKIEETTPVEQKTIANTVQKSTPAVAAVEPLQIAEEKTLVEHTVKAGESLSLIARRYRTSISEIVAANNLTSTVVKAEQTIKVPASSSRDFKVVQSESRVSRASMRMPVRGRLSDKYGWRKHPVYRKRLFHAGIDVAAPKGAPIAAAMNGKVIYAGRRAGYGNLVILSHSNGYSTRYAHCSSMLVKKGQIVKAGQLIARVGATGVATGNHLHFEVRKNGKPQNPLTYLK